MDTTKQGLDVWSHFMSKREKIMSRHLFCPRLLLLRQCTIPVFSSRSFLGNVTLPKPRDYLSEE